MPNVEIKDFNVLTDGKRFFDLPVKNAEEAYEKINEMSKNNEIKLKDPQQTNFIGKLKGKNNGATMPFITEKSEETTFQFLQNSVNIL